MFVIIVAQLTRYFLNGVYGSLFNNVFELSAEQVGLVEDRGKVLSRIEFENLIKFP